MRNKIITIVLTILYLGFGFLYLLGSHGTADWYSHPLIGIVLLWCAYWFISKRNFKHGTTLLLIMGLLIFILQLGSFFIELLDAMF